MSQQKSEKDIIASLKMSLDIELKSRVQMSLQECYLRNKKDFDALQLRFEKKEFVEFLRQRLGNITLTDRGTIKRSNRYGQVKNKQELMEIIERFPEGLKVDEDLKTCMTNAETVLDDMVRNYELRVIILSGQMHYASMKAEKDDKDFGLIIDGYSQSCNQNPPKVYGIKEYLDLCRGEVTEKRTTHLNQNNNQKESSGVDKSRFNILVPNYNEWKKEWLDEPKNKGLRQ